MARIGRTEFIMQGNTKRSGWALAACLAGTLLALAACSSTTSDEQQERITGKVAPQPTAEMAARAGVSLDTLGQGYWIFQWKCLECHEAMITGNLDRETWHPMVEGMERNAGLSGQEEQAMLAYMRSVER